MHWSERDCKNACVVQPVCVCACVCVCEGNSFGGVEDTLCSSDISYCTQKSLLLCSNYELCLLFECLPLALAQPDKDRAQCVWLLAELTEAQFCLPGQNSSATMNISSNLV